MADTPLPYTILAATCEANGKPKPIDADEAVKRFRAKSGLAWIHIIGTDIEATRALLLEKFEFNELDVEDALSEGDRAEVEEHDEFLFVSIPVAIMEKEGERFHELAIFVTKNAVVSVTTVEIDVVTKRFNTWSRHAIPENETSAGILHGLLDAVVDAYFPISDRFQDELDDLEEAVLERSNGLEVRTVLTLKRRLLAFRRRVSPMRDAINGLLRRESQLIPSKLWPYFHDCYDQSLRLVEIVDLDRDILTSILDAHLSVVSNRLNEIMRMMTVAATILMSVTLVASIYGMNFIHMPELDKWWGYPAALLLMAVVALCELWIFRKKGLI